MSDVTFETGIDLLPTDIVDLSAWAKERTVFIRSMKGDFSLLLVELRVQSSNSLILGSLQDIFSMRWTVVCI